MTTTAGTRAATGDETAQRFASLRRRSSRWPKLAWGDLLALLGVLAVLAFLWGRAAGTWLWGDEGISVGISSHSLGSIPRVLRRDGSPPLYYVLLHFWTSVFGTSEVATHFLSLLFALALVPAALWAGWTLFGRRAGWMCAILAALNPVLAQYANETRMYTVAAFFGLLATASFLHAFVFGRRRFLPLFAVSLTLLLYTHNWGILFALGVGAAVVPCMVLSENPRRVFFDAIMAFGVVGLLYAPWVPTLVYQVTHHPNPWARMPTLERARNDMADLVGGPVVLIVLALATGASFTTMFGWPFDGRARALLCAAVLVVVVFAVGLLGGIWHVKYLLVVLGAVLLIGAVGLAASGRSAVVALVAVAFLSGPIAVKTPPYRKSNVKQVANEVRARLRPSDLVISPFGDVALLSYYLPAGLRYATPEGYVSDEKVPDWRNSMARLRASRPAVSVPPLLDSVTSGAHVLVVCPRFEESPPDLLPYLDLISRECQAAKQVAAADARLRLDMSMAPPSGVEATPAAEATLFTRVG